MRNNRALPVALVGLLAFLAGPLCQPCAAADAQSGEKKVVFVAGKKSHGYGAHEHKAGCMLLAKCLEESGLPIKTVVTTDGWPEDKSIFDGADCVVMYADGGGGHPANRHLPEINALAERGVGIVCVHYAVEVPKGEPGDRFLSWIGGYFETHWSVNPHWTPEFNKLPKHPTAAGVKPFAVNDEWYYHMRFPEKLQNVTPILSNVPPQSTLSRPDGAHSGNPDVRKAVADGQTQHVAWAFERPGGGRGFGFTGGHVHWNWGNDNFRKLVLNSIVWASGLEVPAEGVSSKTPTVEELEANQDYPQPGNFDRARIQAMMDGWNKPAASE